MVQGFVNTHMTNRGRGMIGSENVMIEKQRDVDKHQHFLVVLDRLEDNELAIKKGEPVLAY